MKWAALEPVRTAAPVWAVPGVAAPALAVPSTLAAPAGRGHDEGSDHGPPAPVAAVALLRRRAKQRRIRLRSGRAAGSASRVWRTSVAMGFGTAAAVVAGSAAGGRVPATSSESTRAIE